MFEIFNPFTDKDFANVQQKTGKAKEVFELEKGQFAYLFKLTSKLNILYATCEHKKLQKIAMANNVVYTLIESYEAIKNPTANPIKQIIARHTVAIDLQASQEELLGKMHPKGRYNIKLAGKKGVEIVEETDVENFYPILQETCLRDGFNPNPKEFYQTFLSELSKKKKAKLYMAYYHGKPIAGVLNTYFKNTAIYYYGASSNQYRNLMAPYLLQWHAILEAKQDGYKFYDFLGTADPSNPKDPLKGVTFFKQKFGGQKISWPASKVIINHKLFYFLLRLKNFIGI